MKRLITFLAAALFAAGVHAAELGDDGLYKTPWMRDTFKDLTEDLAEANAEGKRLMIMVEQRGCIYCKKMHEEVFVVPEIEKYIEENYFVVQINMFGDVVMGIEHHEREQPREQEASAQETTPSINKR